MGRSRLKDIFGYIGSLGQLGLYDDYIKTHLRKKKGLEMF